MIASAIERPATKADLNDDGWSSVPTKQEKQRELKERQRRAAQKREQEEQGTLVGYDDLEGEDDQWAQQVPGLISNQKKKSIKRQQRQQRQKQQSKAVKSIQSNPNSFTKEEKDRMLGKLVQNEKKQRKRKKKPSSASASSSSSSSQHHFSAHTLRSLMTDLDEKYGPKLVVEKIKAFVEHLEGHATKKHPTKASLEQPLNTLLVTASNNEPIEREEIISWINSSVFELAESDQQRDQVVEFTWYLIAQVAPPSANTKENREKMVRKSSGQGIESVIQLIARSRFAPLLFDVVNHSSRIHNYTNDKHAFRIAGISYMLWLSGQLLNAAPNSVFVVWTQHFLPLLRLETILRDDKLVGGIIRLLSQCVDVLDLTTPISQAEEMAHGFANLIEYTTCSVQEPLFQVQEKIKTVAEQPLREQLLSTGFSEQRVFVQALIKLAQHPDAQVRLVALQLASQLFETTPNLLSSPQFQNNVSRKDVLVWFRVLRCNWHHLQVSPLTMFELLDAWTNDTFDTSDTSKAIQDFCLSWQNDLRQEHQRSRSNTFMHFFIIVVFLLIGAGYLVVRFGYQDTIVENVENIFEKYFKE
mmetsp:Transcript_18133/g.26985  ORF Transcript_18133/g.26985 Transcript_18133/m.26985 type:complete len:585 (+) Transcript_18133:39-1793(+)